MEELSISLGKHLASPREPGNGQARARRSATKAEEGVLRPMVQVLLVVFTDRETERRSVSGWKESWAEGTVHGTSDLRVIDVHVHHYGWPQLALRRWETYLGAQGVLRDSDFAMHIDCDAQFVLDVSAALLTAESFGVLHADNAFYSGDEIVSFDEEGFRHVRTRDLPGFLSHLRGVPRGYWDQACSPKFCRVEPPYNEKTCQVICVCMHACVCIFVSVCSCVCLCKSAYMYLLICNAIIFERVCMHACMHVRMYT